MAVSYRKRRNWFRVWERERESEKRGVPAVHVLVDWICDEAATNDDSLTCKWIILNNSNFSLNIVGNGNCECVDPLCLSILSLPLSLRFLLLCGTFQFFTKNSVRLRHVTFLC